MLERSGQTLVKTALALLAIVFGNSGHAIVLPFSAHGTGPFSVVPVEFAPAPPFPPGTPLTLREDQTLAFDLVLPFALDTGVFRGFAHVFVFTFPDRIFDTSFTESNAAGDALFGTYTVEISTFTDPLDPAAGDFTGSEDFSGFFTFTGGTGVYARASGGGKYEGHSEYTGADPLTLFSGVSELTATGTVILAEPPTLLLGLLGMTAIAAIRRRSSGAFAGPRPARR